MLNPGLGDGSTYHEPGYIPAGWDNREGRDRRGGDYAGNQELSESSMHLGSLVE